jgi:D-serine deaminase-like pyridoxal phosphate-dependent protein
MRRLSRVTLLDIPTPALLVDVAALDRNLARMAAFFADGPCRLRPHFKAHKTPEIARRQLAAGSCVGITCATVAEAEVAADLCDDLLIANEIVTADKCARVAALAGRVTIAVAVDSVQGIEVLAAAARAAGVTIGVLIDVNVGQGRCGVDPGDAAVALATCVASVDGLTLRGVMGYEGHLQPLRDRAERDARTREAMHGLVETAQRIRAAHMACDVVSSGGTGTFDISGRFAGVTEIQAGSYALMDSDYGSVGVPFEQAFTVLGTIVSRPVPERCVADCGHKSMTKDHGHPTVKGVDGATVTALNDEHAVLAVPLSCTLSIGERIQLIPSHTDPTVNLHDVFYAVDGDRVVGVWPIAARGYAEHRS